MFNKIRKINFGNGVSYIIDEFKIKQLIINYIFNNISVINLYPVIIKDEQHLLHLKNNLHYAIPNIIGDTYILIFIDINDISYCVLIDKTTFDYKKNNINYNKLKIISIKLRVTPESYLGTIFDGKIIVSKGITTFLINDAYIINGKNL